MNGYTGGSGGTWMPDPFEKPNQEIVPFDLPDIMEPKVAYRSWEITSFFSGKEDEFHLISHNGSVWSPGKPIQASCGNGNAPIHNSPKENCTCGVYATTQEAIANVPLNPSFTKSEIVCGEVYLWGKIMEGPRGYRAEFAYPKRFIVRSEAQKKQVEALGFNVPVVIVRGRRWNEFPFAMSKMLYLRRFLLTYGSGLPVLLAAALDSLIWNMSEWYNQVVICLLLLLGLTASYLPLILKWQIRRMLRQ